MNAIQSTIATLVLSAAVSPAFAATDGVPPNLANRLMARVTENVTPVAATAPETPQYLPGLGEISLMPNPAFVSLPTQTSARMGRTTPLRAYVGA